MSNEKTELFLDTWRRLETAAEHLLGSDARGGNAVLRLCRDPRFAAYREPLDYCREVRNLLSHQAKLDGQYAVTPSDAVQRLLEEVLCKVEEPQRVCDVMTPVDRMLTATPQTGVLEVMRKMRQQGLSHVPLLENGRVSGIFSVETIFQAVTDNACRVGEDTVLAAFARYLPLDRHMGHDFRFVGRGVLTAEAEAIFDRAGSRNHKLKLLLVTRSGAAAEPLLGVVSPYDLLGQPD